MDLFDPKNAITADARDKKFALDEITKKYGKDALRRELEDPTFSQLKDIVQDDWDAHENGEQEMINYRSVLFFNKKRASDFMEKTRASGITPEQIQHFAGGMPCVLYEDMYDIDAGASKVTCSPCPPHIRKLTKAFLKQMKLCAQSKCTQVSSDDTKLCAQSKCTQVSSDDTNCEHQWGQKTWDKKVATPLVEHWKHELDVECTESHVRIHIGRQHSMVKTYRELRIPNALRHMEIVTDEEHFFEKLPQNAHALFRLGMPYVNKNTSSNTWYRYPAEPVDKEIVELFETCIKISTQSL